MVDRRAPGRIHFFGLSKIITNHYMDARLMPESLKSELLIKEYILPVGEAVIATEMEEFYTKYPGVKIGLYPSSQKFGQEVKVRFRCRKNDTQTLTDFDALMSNIATRVGSNTTVVKVDTYVWLNTADPTKNHSAL